MSWHIEDKTGPVLQLKSKLGLHYFVPTTPKPSPRKPTTPQPSPKKQTLTVVEMQQLPDLEKNDTKKTLA